MFSSSVPAERVSLVWIFGATTKWITKLRLFLINETWKNISLYFTLKLTWAKSICTQQFSLRNVVHYLRIAANGILTKRRVTCGLKWTPENHLTTTSGKWRRIPLKAWAITAKIIYQKPTHSTLTFWILFKTSHCRRGWIGVCKSADPFLFSRNPSIRQTLCSNPKPQPHPETEV